MDGILILQHFGLFENKTKMESGLKNMIQVLCEAFRWLVRDAISQPMSGLEII